MGVLWLPRAERVTCPNCRGRKSDHWPFGPCTICNGKGYTTAQKAQEVINRRNQMGVEGLEDVVGENPETTEEPVEELEVVDEPAEESEPLVDVPGEPENPSDSPEDSPPIEAPDTDPVAPEDDHYDPEADPDGA